MENVFTIPEMQEVIDLFSNKDNIPPEYEKAEITYNEGFECVRDKIKSILDGESVSDLTTDLLKLDIDVSEDIAQAEIYGFRLGARLALALAAK